MEQINICAPRTARTLCLGRLWSLLWKRDTRANGHTSGLRLLYLGSSCLLSMSRDARNPEIDCSNNAVLLQKLELKL